MKSPAPRSRIPWELVAVLFSAFAPRAAGEGNPAIEWTGGFDSAREQARIEQRIVMVHFYTTWCGWCRRMESETYGDAAVVQLSRRLACVRIDAEEHPDLALKYGARAYPTVVFADPSGKLLEAARGYHPPDRFRSLLERILDRSGEEFILRQRLRDHPELIAVRADLARTLASCGKYEEALVQYDTLLAGAGPLSAIPWNIGFDRARVLLRSGNAKAAREEFESLARAAPDDASLAETRYFLAESRRSLGDRGGARKELERLLEMRSDGWLAERARIGLRELR